MANSDLFAFAPDGSSKPADHAGESPRIVPLSSSFDLGAFPSETPEPAEEPPAASVSLTAEAADETTALEVQSIVAAPSAIEATGLEQSEPRAPVPPLAPDDDVRSRSTLETSPSPSETHVEGHHTLADLLERHGGLGWREAVGIVHALCLRLQDSPTHAPILLEPRNIEITTVGDVDLLPSQTGGDPLVIQVGRLLRTMLAGEAIPPELRLLISQATFELPIFKSVSDLAKALQHVGDLQQTEDVRTSLMLKTQPVLVAAPQLPQQSQPPRPILPVPFRNDRTRARRRRVLSANGALVGAILLAAGLTAALFLIRSGSAPQNASGARPNAAAPVAAAEATPPAGASMPIERSPVESPRQPAVDPPVPRGMTGSAPLAHTVKPNGRTRGAAPRPDAVPYPALPYEPPAPPAPRVGSNTSPGVSPRETERRAAALIADGQAHEASMVFDGLVLANPLYEPKGQDLTPEALAAFRASRKLLLPVIALRDYDRAKNALSTGDPERALLLGNQVTAILDRIETEPTPNLRRNVQELVDKAASAKLSMEEVVYSRAGAGIVLPRLLSRGFPATTPAGVPANRVGTVELIVGRLGDVEFVKLYTPLNRYHERMIVSAVKAWRFQPATKDGRPIRFRLTMTINLPESGAE
jgi:hypothetical protein